MSAPLFAIMAVLLGGAIERGWSGEVIGAIAAVAAVAFAAAVIEMAKKWP